MTKNFPVVSVIIPTYNRCSLLCRSIQSVLNQTYEDIEVIVVDDCSTDGTPDMVRAMSDSRIRYVAHDNNSGNSAARNSGIQNATGEFFAFQDDDDRWVENKLEKQMRCFEEDNSGVDIVYSGFIRIHNGKSTYIPKRRSGRMSGNIHAELLKGNFVTTQVVVARRECFSNNATFDELLHRLVDWELWLRLSKKHLFAYIDEPLVISEEQEDGISRNTRSLVNAMEYILTKHEQDFRKHKAILMQHYFWLSYMHCKLGNVPKGIHFIMQAVKACAGRH